MRDFHIQVLSVRNARRTLHPLLLVVAISACRAKSDDGSASAQKGDIEALDKRIAAAQAELARVNREVEEKRNEAVFLSCKADVEGFKTEVNLARAECSYELAMQMQCIASAARSKGDSALLGCGLGFLAATFTGGAATPWALGGCFAGRVAGEVGADECPVPECSGRDTELYGDALKARGWERPPQCGGVMGVQVETPLLGLVGVLKVVDPGVLGEAGVSQGDRIAYVNDIRVKSDADLQRVLQGSVGAEVDVSLVRDEILWKARMTLPSSEIYFRQYRVVPEYRAEHRYGARIVSVSERSALAGRELVGRDVFKVDGVEVVNTDHLYDLLRYRKTGEQVEIVLRTPNVMTLETVTVQLGPRNDKWSL